MTTRDAIPSDRRDRSEHRGLRYVAPMIRWRQFDSMKSALKALARGTFLVLLLPCAILSSFGRVKPIYTLFAHACALLPGIVGEYARAAYYSMTLQRCTLHTGIGFGTIFAHREAMVARGVTIGAYCVLGRVRLGEGTLIAS